MCSSDLGSLVEIYLLFAFVPDGEIDWMNWDHARERALKSATRVAEAAELDKFIVESTHRQINRYINWWSKPLWTDWLVQANRRHHPAVWKRLDPVVTEISTLLEGVIANRAKGASS